MTKEITNFLVRLLAFAGLLFAIHFYLMSQFFEGQLYFPLWAVYCFNIVVVAIVFMTIRYQSQKGNKKMYQLFLGLTILKMVLAIVFLTPLFFGKSDHAQLEVINFFIPYFLFLAFEIFSLNQFLQKS